MIRDKCKEELAGLKALRRNVTDTLSKLKLETQRLQREDEVIRDQEEKLRMGFEQVEQKHVQYQAKGSTVVLKNCQTLTSFFKIQLRLFYMKQSKYLHSAVRSGAEDHKDLMSVDNSVLHGVHTVIYSITTLPVYAVQ